jgi:multicomponent Na+:H+ antiporter subunit E
MEKDNNAEIKNVNTGRKEPIVIFAVILLAGTWVILSEDISVITIISGIVIGILCIYISNKLLPAQKIKNIKVFRLIIYIFYLFIQIYLSAFKVLKLIFTGARVDIVYVKTKIKNSFLQTMLANSITLPPGTISLDLKDSTITVLRLTNEKDDQDEEIAGEVIKGKFEKMLLKMEK